MCALQFHSLTSGAVLAKNCSVFVFFFLFFYFLFFYLFFFFFWKNSFIKQTIVVKT